MEISPNQDVQIKAFSPAGELHIPEELAVTLTKVFNEQITAWEIAKKNNVLKAEVVAYKIKRLLPELKTIPFKLITSCKDDQIFKSLIKFCDICLRIRKDTKVWPAEKIHFDHFLFIDLSIIHQELSRKLYNAIDEYPDEIDDLMKDLMSQAYLPSNITLTIQEARKIIPDLSAPTEEALYCALNSAERLEVFVNVVKCCQNIIRLKEMGVADLERLTKLYKKLKEHLMPLVLVSFREEKKVFQLAEKMIIAAEEAKYTGYLSWLW